MSFQISDKVVCVDDFNQGSKRIRDFDPVHKGLVYTISAISHSSKFGLGVRVVGAYAGTSPITNGEHYWKASRFRKLSDVKSENAAKRRKKEPQP